MNEEENENTDNDIFLPQLNITRKSKFNMSGFDSKEVQKQTIKFYNKSY